MASTRFYHSRGALDDLSAAVRAGNLANDRPAYALPAVRSSMKWCLRYGASPSVDTWTQILDPIALQQERTVQ